MISIYETIYANDTGEKKWIEASEFWKAEGRRRGICDKFSF